MNSCKRRAQTQSVYATVYAIGMRAWAFPHDVLARRSCVMWPLEDMTQNSVWTANKL